MVAARSYENPRGSRLPALEQNILRYRAMEMVLALFYAEDLRKTIIGCVQTTDRMKRVLDDKAEQPEHVAAGAGNPLQKALAALVADQTLSEDEKREIEKLINYRNDIAHRLEELTADISLNKVAREYARFRPTHGPKYDYYATERLRFYRRLVEERTRRKHVLQLSIAPLLFEGAEKALTLGLRRLRRTIDRQFAARGSENAQLNAELSLDGTGLTGDLHPRHPYNKYESGVLTARGVGVCYRLFDLGRSPVAVAHLMRISLRAAAKRRKMWQAAGGIDRRKCDFNTMTIRKFYGTSDD
jgi:hypothetical protein